MYDQRTRSSNQSLNMLKQQYGQGVWDGTIPVDTLFRDASKLGLPLPSLNSTSKGVQAYEDLLQHLQNTQTDLSELPHV
jgi:chromosome partitioning protein